MENTKMEESKVDIEISEIEKLKKEKQEYLDLARQVQADFDNYRKRTKVQIEDTKVEGMMKALECIFEALDSFKKAKNVIADKASLAGVKIIEEQMLKSLKRLGIERISSVNQAFNPDLHNAVAVVEDTTKKPSTIIEEVQAGYTYDGKVIRFCQVIVNK